MTFDDIAICILRDHKSHGHFLSIHELTRATCEEILGGFTNSEGSVNFSQACTCYNVFRDREVATSTAMGYLVSPDALLEAIKAYAHIAPPTDAERAQVEDAYQKRRDSGTALSSISGMTPDFEKRGILRELRLATLEVPNAE